jgi:hypothetical protein
MRELGNRSLSRGMVLHVHSAMRQVACGVALPTTALPEVPPTDSPADNADARAPCLKTFICHVALATRVPILVLLSVPVYAERLQRAQKAAASSMPGGQHLVFLASLILAYKTLEDDPLTLRYWCRRSRCKLDDAYIQFLPDDVERMEEEVICRLGWNLNIGEQELCRHLELFLEPIRHRNRNKRNGRAGGRGKLG